MIEDGEEREEWLYNEKKKKKKKEEEGKGKGNSMLGSKRDGIRRRGKEGIIGG